MITKITSGGQRGRGRSELSNLLQKLSTGKPIKGEDVIARTAYNALARHGIPVHIDLLTVMVYDELSGFDIRTEPTDVQRVLVAKVANAVSRHPELFKRIDRGVYFLKGKREGRT